eukprot:4418050-Amphidinium_carterae.3
MLRELVIRKGSQPGRDAVRQLMTWLSQQDIATERQVKYLRDLARKRAALISADELISNQSASEQRDGLVDAEGELEEVRRTVQNIPMEGALQEYEIAGMAIEQCMNCMTMK